MPDRIQGQGIMVLCLLLATGLSQAGGIYKWIDADGGVHYGEHPPATGAEEMHISSSSRAKKDPDSVSAHVPHDLKAQRDKMIRALEGDRLARREKRQQQKEALQKRKMQCAQARDTLRQYQRAASLYKLDADGNRQILPEAVKQQETQRLQAQIKQWCK